MASKATILHASSRYSVILRRNFKNMRILFITPQLQQPQPQRLFCELTGRGHQLSIEFDISDSVTEEAVALFQPELIVAPFLKRAIPASVWSRHRCLIVHPGVPSDHEPSALDWAIQRGVDEWGVTVLQAEARMDAGPVWASANFPMTATREIAVYFRVTEAAVRAAAGGRHQPDGFVPQRRAGAGARTHAAERSLHRLASG